MHTTPHILGALPAPAWHRPWLRYVDPVDGAQATPPVEPAEPVDPPADPDPASPAPTDPETPAPEAADELPEWARKSLTKANKEAAAARAAAKQAKDDAAAAQQTLVQSIGKALGLVQDNEEPTVESLTSSLQERDQNLTSTQAALAAQRAENAVLRVAGTLNADADALLDSRGFTEKLAAVDPAADDYASQVEALVKAEVESNARYRKVQVAPRSSNGDPAPAGGNPAPEGIESMRKSFADRRADGA